VGSSDVDNTRVRPAPGSESRVIRCLFPIAGCRRVCRVTPRLTCDHLATPAQKGDTPAGFWLSPRGDEWKDLLPKNRIAATRV